MRLDYVSCRVISSSFSVRLEIGLPSPASIWLANSELVEMGFRMGYLPNDEAFRPQDGVVDL